MTLDEESGMAAPGENMRINADRLWDTLMDMAKIGPGIAGGNNRQTLTDEDGEGRRLFQPWAEGAGMTMGVDTMGNMFFTRPGTDPGCPARLCRHRISTRSRPAANMTACSACSPALNSSAR